MVQHPEEPGLPPEAQFRPRRSVATCREALFVVNLLAFFRAPDLRTGRWHDSACAPSSVRRRAFCDEARSAFAVFLFSLVGPGLERMNSPPEQLPPSRTSVVHATIECIYASGDAHVPDNCANINLHMSPQSALPSSALARSNSPDRFWRPATASSCHMALPPPPGPPLCRHCLFPRRVRPLTVELPCLTTPA